MGKKTLLFLASAVGPVVGIAVAAVAFNAPASDWHIAGPFGGSASSLAVDPQKPNVLLAGGMNSLVFRSEDSGENWRVLDFPKRHLTEVSSVLVDPTNSNHYLAGVISSDGGGLYSSQDQGNSWTLVKSLTWGVRSVVAAASRPTRFMAGTLHGVMLSDDSGATWTRISDPKNLEMEGITATAIDPSNPDILYAGTSHLPWKSNDGGKTWNSIHTGMSDDSDVFSIYVNPSDPGNIFASACSGIYASGDRGDQWKKVMGLSFSQRRTHVIRKDPQTAGTLYAGTTMGLFKSPNLGASWKLLSKEQVNSIVFDPARPGSMYMAMEYEGLAHATETGENIRMLNRGFVDRTISWATRSGSSLVALETQLGETSGIFISQDRGENWHRLPGVKGLDGVHLTTITGIPGDEHTLLAAAPHRLFKSADGGLLWKPMPVRLVIPAPKAAPAPVVRSSAKGKTAVRKTAAVRRPVDKIKELTIDEFHGLYGVKYDAKTLLFMATNLGLLRSEDGGERWTMADLGTSTAVQGLSASPNEDGRLVARATTGLFLSADGGEHWTSLSFPVSPSDVNDVALSADPASPILVAGRLGLYATSDQGAHWSVNAGDIPASTVNSVIYGAGNTAYAVEYGRLYESGDAGAHWKMASSVMAAPRIRRLWMPDVAGNRLYAITTDLGILFRN